jgi:hypothetical protein
MTFLLGFILGLISGIFGLILFTLGAMLKATHESGVNDID